MNKELLRVLTLFSLMLLFGVLSCNPCRFDGPIYEDFCTTVETTYLTPYDNTTGSAINTNGDVAAKDMTLRLGVGYAENICFKPRVNSWINAAYACSPAIETTKIIKDSVASVDIISNNDFDPQHKAGELLNDYFTLPATTEFSYQVADSFDLQLMQAPADTGIHIFTLSINLTDGRKIESSTSSVRIY